MACPHPLQAHQIQGLDYQAVLPVVQWLVKRVLATLEEFGDQVHCPLISRRLTTTTEHTCDIYSHVVSSFQSLEIFL